MSRGSVATRRRAGLRRHARNRLVSGALELFAKMTALATAVLDIDRLPCEGPATSAKRLSRAHRDLFPLPNNASTFIAVLGGALAPRGVMALSCLVDASAGALTLMNGKKAIFTSMLRTNCAQLAAINSLALRWFRLALHYVGDGAQVIYDTGAFARLVDKGAGGTAVRLRAAMVDSLATCSQVDPTCFLPGELLDVVEDPGALFQHEGDMHGNMEARFAAGPASECIFLVRQQCRGGKGVFAHTCKHAASSFPVAKANTGRQREVWDGSALCEVSRRPPAPPWLSSPADLTMLERSDGKPLLMSVRDGQSFSIS